MSDAHYFKVGPIDAVIDVEDALRFFGKYLNATSAGYIGLRFDGSTFLLHRLIMGLEKGDPRQVDHINGNRADNRKSNLRLASPSQNAMNKARKDSQSGITGVWWDGNRERWCVQIRADRRRINLGRYVSREDAIAARARGEEIYHGAFSTKASRV